jgi:four helix bundle protein
MARGDFGFLNQFVWQDATRLAQEVYDLTSGFPAEEPGALAGQLRQTAVSLSSAIAEAYAGVPPPQQLERLTAARTTLHALAGQAHVARHLGFLDAAGFARLDERARQVLGRLNGLISTLTPAAPHAGSRIATLTHAPR